MAVPLPTDRYARSRRASVWLKRTGVLLAFALGAIPGAVAQDSGGTSATTDVYVHSDSDSTTVVTPRIHVGAALSDATRLDLVYTTDIWTSASIDIRTSASKRLDAQNEYKEQEPVSEQRDEIDVALEHALSDVTLGASYRYSIENDYESHGGSFGGAYDFADNNANIALTVRAFFDQVGRAGDPAFERKATTLSARAAFTQVLDASSLVQIVYELEHLHGYLSSPYRYVRIATDAGVVPSTCVYAAANAANKPLAMCVPERNPDLRVRHAIGLQGRRALSSTVSLGLSYRFYIDDWDITSHTAGIDAAWVPANDWLLSLGYRFYHQSAASHYAPFYAPMPLPELYTSDKELTSLSSHRIELALERTFVLDAMDSRVRTALRVAPAYFQYFDFPLLDDMKVIEVTGEIGVTL